MKWVILFLSSPCITCRLKARFHSHWVTNNYAVYLALHGLTPKRLKWPDYLFFLKNTFIKWNDKSTGLFLHVCSEIFTPVYLLSLLSCIQQRHQLYFYMGCFATDGWAISVRVFILNYFIYYLNFTFMCFWTLTGWTFLLLL